MFKLGKVAMNAFTTIGFVGVTVFSAVNVVSAQTVPTTTAYSSISVYANNVSYRDLYNFTTDLRNDQLWFPNVASTVVTKGPDSPYSKKGTQYNQISYFNGIELDTNVTVTGDFPTFVYTLDGVGPVATYKALYTFNPGPNNTGVFTLTTKFTSPGLTKEALTYLLNLAMQNILAHFNTTGTVNMNFIYVQ